MYKQVFRRLLLIAPLALFLLLVTAGSVLAQDKPGAFVNPLNVNTVPKLLARITSWLLSISAVIALLALVVGGFRFILAFGNEEALKSAKSIIKWSVAGLAIIALSFLIIRVLSQALGFV